MSKYTTIIICIAFISGFILFTIGILSGDLILCAIGGVIAVLVPVILKLIKEQKKEGSFLDYVENKNESLLPLKKTVLKKEDNKIKVLMMLFIALTALGFSSILMKNYIFEPSYFTLQQATYEGCAKLNIQGVCNSDPSQILVPLDVNKDGTVGGVNDTLTNLFDKYYNCTGSCVKRRCSCTGY